MTNYTKTTNFTAKDSLPTGDSNKIIRGSDFDTEFDNIVTAVATKANTASPTFTGTVVLPSDTTVGSVSSTELGYVNGVTSAIQTQLDAKAPTASPTFTGTVVLPSGTSIGTVTSTEIGYLDNVTSSIQTQLNAKAPTASPTFTGTVTLPSSTSVGSVSSTELGYVNGVTSAIQTQLDAKATMDAYESAEQTIPTTASYVSVSHGLGAVPDIIQLWIVCKTTDNGYAVNDRVLINSNLAGSGQRGSTIWVNSTSLGFAVNGDDQITVVPKTGGSAAVIDHAKWKAVLKAWIFS